MSEWAQQYRDPRWQRRRLEIMGRADFRCEYCNAGNDTLNVHHKLYRKGAAPWEYTDEELVCICECCHEEEHELWHDLKFICSKFSLHFLRGLVYHAADMRAGFEAAHPELSDEQ